MELKNINKELPTIFIMVGIPGSGKSTYANMIADEYNIKIHSSDSIRKELTGTEADLTSDKKVFKILNDRILNDLNTGNSTIYDATNLSPKKRAEILKLIKEINCNKVCIFVNTSVSECYKRNSLREKKVPPFVIGKLSKSLIEPILDEGFDDIITY